MPLTPAERAKRYREKKKATENSRLEFLKKDRERKKQNYIPINERSQRDQRKTRKQWCKAQENHRVHVQLQKSSNNEILTPPTTPTDDAEGHFRFPTAASRRGRSRVRRDRSKAHRDLMRVQRKLERTVTTYNKYRKRFERFKNRYENSSESPRSKTNKLLKCLNKDNTSKVRKTLIFHNALISEMKSRYEHSKEQREKSVLSQIISGKIIKKYRMHRKAIKAVKCYGKKQSMNRQTRKDAITSAMKKSVNDFFCRDDNSRQLPGKKDTITRHKIKQQKRLLNDTIKNLHLKYIFENPNSNISYSKFTVLRPFWVVIPSLSDRETCLCRRHSNIELMTEKLFTEKAISDKDFVHQLEYLVCSLENKTCMYGECERCKDNWLPNLNRDLREREIEFYQWISKKENRTKVILGGKEENFDVKVTLKEKISSNLDQLYEKYQKELKTRFARHLFNIRNQYKVLREIKQNLAEDEAIIHIDFSENYSCKYSEEVQSVHFGASRNQISLHTGICYKGTQLLPFCSVSDSMRHDPAAFWAHIMPVLEKFAPVENTSSLHFVSDGLTTQYRNKSNFYLTATVPLDMGYKRVTWNFLEAGHGKGAADGIGGVLKRTADKVVANGIDIKDTIDFLNYVNPETNVELFQICCKDITRFDEKIKTQLKTINGTMKIHQLIFDSVFTGTIKHREISCFCQGSKFTCECYNLQTVTILNTVDEDNTYNETGSVEGQGVEGRSFIQPIQPDDDLLDKWCMVVYDGLPYPGKIVDYDADSVEVDCMSRVGVNRFFWPSFKDIIWYEYDTVLTLIPPPTNVTARHLQVDKHYWEAVCKHMDL